ncbi:Enhancer of mRNA-decapping protein 3 [Portunus trituberculatus]|uniref:Enhancer of mRNA-decapping protein 3 n=1 Tax=Portunus trituberculatus TaxID=210409 RepID=A0A5B7HZA3_PORTR|nr:Enhancer of mRNA-decapping protein 3 [Portunus trituberculatus]
MRAFCSTALRDGAGEWQQMGQGQLPSIDYSSPRRGDTTRTPNKKERQRRARNEATFGTPIDDMLTTEFDFESNLALFDKQVR